MSFLDTDNVPAEDGEAEAKRDEAAPAASVFVEIYWPYLWDGEGERDADR